MESEWIGGSNAMVSLVWVDGLLFFLAIGYDALHVNMLPSGSEVGDDAFAATSPR